MVCGRISEMWFGKSMVDSPAPGIGGSDLSRRRDADSAWAEGGMSIEGPLVALAFERLSVADRPLPLSGSGECLCADGARVSGSWSECRFPLSFSGAPWPDEVGEGMTVEGPVGEVCGNSEGPFGDIVEGREGVDRWRLPEIPRSLSTR